MATVARLALCHDDFAVGELDDVHAGRDVDDLLLSQRLEERHPAEEPDHPGRGGRVLLLGVQLELRLLGLREKYVFARYQAGFA